MRKTPLALGIIFLFIGIITFSISNTAIEKLPEHKRIERALNLPYGKWNISAQLNKSEKIFVLFSRPKLEVIPDGLAIINVSIIDPKGGNTNFSVAFSQEGVEYINLTWNDNGLTVNDSVEGIGGTTLYTGNYTVQVYADEFFAKNYYYPPAGTLPALELYKVIEKKDYPYRILLPIAITLIFISIYLTVWSTKSSKHPSKLKKKNKI